MSREVQAVSSTTAPVEPAQQHAPPLGSCLAGSSSWQPQNNSMRDTETFFDYAEATEAEILLAEGPDKALLVLSRNNPVRRTAAAVVSSRAFEVLILALILANCATLAMYSHQPGFDDTPLAQALGYADIVFAAAFSAELVLKVLAMGLVVEPGTYLRNGWNVMDCIVVLLGWLDVALNGEAYTFLRIVRVLRPLRTITHIKGLKAPVATLAKALPMLLDVLILCLFAFFIFGVVAVQLFAGVLRNRCAAADFSYAYLLPAAAGAQQAYANVSYVPPADGSAQSCSGYLATDVTWSLQPDAAGGSAGTPVWTGGSPGGGWACPTQPQQPDTPFGTFCAAVGNPNSGMTSFDNLLWAWMTCFQCITTEGWTDVMYAMQDALSPWVLVYFILLIIFGAFFLVNLALAVLYLQFTKEFSVSAAASRVTSRAVSRCNSCAPSRVNTVRVQEPQRESVQRWQQEASSIASTDQSFGRQQQQQQASITQEHAAAPAAVSPGVLEAVSQRQCVRQEPQCSDEDLQLPGSCVQPAGESAEAAAATPRKRPLPGASGVTWGRLTGELSSVPATSLQNSLRTAELITAEGAEQEVTASVLVTRRTLSTKPAHGDAKDLDLAGEKLQQSPRAILKLRGVQQQQQQQQQQPQVLQQQAQPDSWGQHCRWQLQAYGRRVAGAWGVLRLKCRELIKSGWLEIASLIVIITNTAIMASQSYPSNPDWQLASDYLNVGFCFYFVLELLIKLMGVGFAAFIRDRMNQFDGLVVVASLVEAAIFLMPGDEANASSLSVLRAARLLRVFKLARSWAELNRIITTVLKSFSQVMYLSLLLLLFMFVFALMGMQLFGFQFSSCSLATAQQLCPPGVPLSQCPTYPDCYVPCQDSQVFTWIIVTGSPYNNMAYCEAFPRDNTSWGNATAAGPSGVQYLAQVGKAVVPSSRFDNIGWAIVTVFQIITTENWNNVAYNGMAATSPAAFLWFVVIIVFGNYILLNLFLAILLENFSTSGGAGGNSSANSAGGTLAAAAKSAQLMAWMQDRLQASWFAKMLQHRNRVAAAEQALDADDGDELVAPHSQDSGSQALAAHASKAALQGGDVGAGTAGGAAATRGAASLLEAGAGDGSFTWHTGPRASAAAGYPMAAARRRSFTPLIAPSRSNDNLQALANQPGSFVGARAHSVTALCNATSSVSRSAKSCTLGSFLSRGAGSNLDVAAASAAATADGEQAAGGATSSHRLAQMVSLHDARTQLLQEQEGCQSGAREQPELPGNLQDQQEAPAQQVPSLPSLNQAALLAYSHPAASLRLHSSCGQQYAAAGTPRKPLVGRSCWLFGPDNCLRLLCHRLLSHRSFERTILVLIFASSIALAMDMPSLDPYGPLKQALETLDCVFAVLFLVEAVIKIVVHGFALNGPDSYLRNPWNALDAVIVVLGMVVMGTTLAGLQHQQSLSSLKALRTLRALRPLRVASRLEGMKVVVNSLFASLPALGNVLLVTLLLFGIFGIMAVNLLGGAMFSCRDPSGANYDADYVLPAGQYINKSWCLDDGLQVTTSAYHQSINVTVPPWTPQRQWSKPTANYDNLLQATLTLWQISTTELWVDTMYRAIAAVGIDQQPRDGHNPALALFFIVFIIVGGFFILQLFVSVTIEKFSEIHAQQGRSAFLTPQQEGWLKIERMMADIDLQVKHRAPTQPWRAAIFKVVMSQHFEWTAMAVIIANCVVMAATHADMNDDWQNFMTWANLSFTAFFTLELLVKFLALGFKPVFMDAWGKFDIVVVAVSIVGAGIDIGTPSNLTFLPILRVLRVARIFKLIPKAEGIKVLLRTLVMSLPALGNIVSVVGLFFFIYAVIGMNLWGSIKEGQFLTRHANFKHMGLALLTLFRMITGESWDGIMQDCMNTSMCMQVLQDVTVPAAGGTSTTSLTAGTWLDPSDPLLAQLPTGAVANRCSPSPLVAVFYFCSFVMLCGLVLVNFVIGVILDNFESSSQTDDLPISKAAVDHFVKVWSELDPQATHYIPAIQLSTLIQELRPPMGVKGEQGCTRAMVQGIIMHVDIPFRQGKIHFLETMHALAGRIAGTEVPEDEELKVRRMLYPRLPSADAADVPKYGVSHFYAALYVQAAVRGFLKRHAGTSSSCGGGAAASSSGQHPTRRRTSLQFWLPSASTAGSAAQAPLAAAAAPAAAAAQQQDVQVNQQQRRQQQPYGHAEPAPGDVQLTQSQPGS